MIMTDDALFAGVKVLDVASFIAARPPPRFCQTSGPT